MSILALDLFNRSDNSNIGSDWTEDSGTWDISSNQLVLSTYSSPSEYYDWAVWDTNLNSFPLADYSVSARVNSGGGNAEIVVGCRWADSSNHYRVELITSSNDLLLKKNISGTDTQLGSYSATINTGTDYSVKISGEGTTIKAFLDGTERISVTDSDLTAKGKPGVGGDADDIVVDDFVVEGVLSTRKFIDAGWTV